MMPAALNFRALVPMVDVMNAIAQVSAAPVTGPKLDNRRVLAGVVDLVIVAAGALVVLVAGDSLTGNRQGALSAVILGWALYYFFALESGDGQTVGKKLMKLRVVRANGSPVGMREVAVRTVLRVVDNYLVGLIVMLATGDRRQRIGDLAAGTIVVDASAPPSAVAEPVEADVEPDVEADVEMDEPVAEEPVVEEPVVEEPSLSRTITLPSRPARPETLSDLAEPAVEEPTEDIVPVVPAEEDSLPELTSPSLEELAADVAAAQDSDEAREPENGSVDVPEDDGPVTVKPVEMVSAMDLVMGAAHEDASEDSSESAQDSEDSA
jgi:uncharacterized RDD family membrane protein YckC